MRASRLTDFQLARELIYYFLYIDNNEIKSGAAPFLMLFPKEPDGYILNIILRGAVAAGNIKLADDIMYLYVIDINLADASTQNSLIAGIYEHSHNERSDLIEHFGILINQTTHRHGILSGLARSGNLDELILYLPYDIDNSWFLYMFNLYSAIIAYQKNIINYYKLRISNNDLLKYGYVRIVLCLIQQLMMNRMKK